MADKYPEFYVRKRQREETYRRVVQVIVGVAILVIVGGVGGFFLYKYVLQPVRQPVPKPKQLAAEREQLATENALASAPEQGAEEGGQPDESHGKELTADLADIPYDPSFPDVNVGVVGSDTNVALGGESGDEDQGAASEENGGSEAEGNTSPTPPSSREHNDSFQEDKDAGAKSDSGSEKEKPAKPAAEKNEEKPADATKESKTEDKPAAKSDEKATQPPPAEEPASGGTIYYVYAGAYATQEAAEVAKKDLQALGFQGQIITVGAEYDVRVASLDDYNRASAIRQKLINSGFSKAFATRKRR